jgi:hypothetical protein
MRREGVGERVREGRRGVGEGRGGEEEGREEKQSGRGWERRRGRIGEEEENIHPL